MTILILIFVLSAGTSALLTWAFGPCEALWWYIVRIPLLFAAAFVAWTALYLLTLLVIAKCVNIQKPVKKAHHGYRWVLTETAQFLLLLGRVHVHAEGLEKVDRTKPFLLVANHRSNFDPFVALSLFKGTESAYVHIVSHHTNVVCIRKNGETLLEKKVPCVSVTGIDHVTGLAEILNV